MTAAGSQRGGISFQIYRILLHQQSSNRLKGNTEIDILTIAQTALYSSAMIALCCNTGSNILIHSSISWRFCSISLRDKDIILLTSAGSNSGKSLTIFKTLHGVNAKHGSTQLGMKLAKFRLAQSYRATLDDASDDSANRIAVGLNLGDEIFHLLRLPLVRTAHRIIFYGVKVIQMIIFLQRDAAYLRCIGRDADAQLSQGKFSQSSAYASGNGDAG